MLNPRMLPLLLTIVIAFGASAQRPQHPGGSRAFVPVIVHAGGIDSQFRSDVFLFNRGTTDAKVNLIFTPTGANGTSQFNAVQRIVAPMQVVELKDLVATQFATTGSGSLEINTDSISLIARSTTYNVRARGNVAQSVVVATENDATGLDEEPLFLMPVEDREEWRTNIGFSETAGQSGVVRITMYSAVGPLDTRELTVLPYSHVQIPLQGNGPFFYVNAASVEVTSGGARVVPYASLVQNQSGDPMYVAGRRAAPAAHQVIPIAGYLKSSKWSSEMWYANVLWASIFDDRPPFDFPPVPGPPPMLTFYPSDNPAASRSYSDLGIASYINNSVFTYFEFFDGAFGNIDVPPSDGSLITTRLAAPAGGGSRFSAGTVGQTVQPVPVAQAIGIGQSVDAIGVAVTAERRTNAGISEVTGAAARVRVTVVDPNNVQLGATEIDVAGHAVVQVPVSSIVPASLPLARVHFTVIGGTGRVLAYASVVENAYGDPTFVLAE